MVCAQSSGPCWLRRASEVSDSGGAGGQGPAGERGAGRGGAGRGGRTAHYCRRRQPVCSAAIVGIFKAGIVKGCAAVDDLREADAMITRNTDNLVWSKADCLRKQTQTECT
jgi:hypothetical protein